MRVLLGLVLLHSLKAVLVSGYVYDPDYLVPATCHPCDAKSCPTLTFCAGRKVKDHCGCCARCSSDLFQPHAAVPQSGVQSPTEAPAEEENKSENPCEKRQCPKFKVCMMNMQGLPICTCPSSYVCKRGGKKDKQPETLVCGSDGITYASRCHLRIANCNSNRRIKQKHDGACTASDVLDNNDRPIESGNTNVLDFGRNIDEEDAEHLETLNRAKKRRLRQKKKDKKKKRQRKRQRKERNKRKGNKRQKRMKRRNEGYNLYSKRYGYLIGRHTKWSRSQIRKSKI